MICDLFDGFPHLLFGARPERGKRRVFLSAEQIRSQSVPMNQPEEHGGLDGCNMNGKLPLHSVKKFYFLEYFYVLLKSVENHSDKAHVFDSFKNLKQAQRLGESKYKKLTSEEELTKHRLNRYFFTFVQVIDEAKQYELVKEENSSLRLTDQGKKLISMYQEEGSVRFTRVLFELMERNYNAFRYLIDLFYRANRYRPGFLIFPNYSPRQLHFERSAVRTSRDIIEYSEKLVVRLQQDIKEFLGLERDLRNENKKLLSRLRESNLLPQSNSAQFAQGKYNVITKRFRDHWMNYFLKQIYGYEASLSSFDIWTYRGKQIGIIHATEFYPGFNGRIVYPTSVLRESTKSKDFQRLYEYDDGVGLYVHEPDEEDSDNRDEFVDRLVKGYFKLRGFSRSYFVNLAALREIVCLDMKISEHVFETFLNSIYRLVLASQLKVQISLEVDKLPEETQAMYLKQEPVMVDGKYRNIIAIDVTKGDKAK